MEWLRSTLPIVVAGAGCAMSWRLGWSRFSAGEHGDLTVCVIVAVRLCMCWCVLLCMLPCVLLFVGELGGVSLCL